MKKDVEEKPANNLALMEDAFSSYGLQAQPAARMPTSIQPLSIPAPSQPLLQSDLPGVSSVMNRLLELSGKCRAIEEEMAMRQKRTRHQYIQLLLEERIHLKWLEIGERIKEELRKAVTSDRRVQTYFNAVEATTRTKEGAAQLVEDIEQLKKRLKDSKPISEEEVLMVEAGLFSLEETPTLKSMDEVVDIELVIEKSSLVHKEEFWEYLGGSIIGNFSLSSEAPISETPVSCAMFEEESKDFKLVTPQKSPTAAEKAKNTQGAMIERMDTALKVKNNKLFDKIQAEMHSDYGPYINSLEFENCYLDSDEAVKIGQLLNDHDTFNFKFTNTTGSIHILLGSVGPRMTIAELCISGSSLQPFTMYFQQIQKVRSVVVENLSGMDVMLLGALIELVSKNASGRSLTLRGVDLAQVPIQLFCKVGELKELRVIRCQLGGFDILLDFVMAGKYIETLEIRGSLPDERPHYLQLAKLFKKNKQVHTLNISENPITPANLRILAQGMTECQNIHTIIMDNCTYESSDQNDLENLLFECIRSCPSLKIFSLKGFMQNDDAKAMALLDKWSQQAPGVRSRVEFF